MYACNCIWDWCNEEAAWASPGNNNEVSTYNLTVFQMFYWTVGKVWKLIPLKKGFILQSKGARFEKTFSTITEIILHFFAALRAVQHILYTSNLLPTPMYISAKCAFILQYCTKVCVSMRCLWIVTVPLSVCFKKQLNDVFMSFRLGNCQWCAILHVKGVNCHAWNNMFNTWE